MIVFGNGAFGRLFLRGIHEGGVLMMELELLSEKILESLFFLFPSAMRGHGTKMAVCKARREPFPETELPGFLLTFYE